MSEIELKARIISILSAHTEEMEGYAYYGSNPGIPEHEYEEIADEVIAALAPQWQGIESAPKDGRWIMLGKPGHGEVLLAYWDRLRDAWFGQGGGDGQWKKWQDATSWQPLPAPPEVEG